MDIKLGDKRMEHSPVFNFGDSRLDNTAEEIYEKMFHKETTCLKSLANSKRDSEVRYGRFLGNDKVTADKINAACSASCLSNSEGVSHILCIQDTCESSYPSQKEMKSSFGAGTNENTPSLFIHGSLLLNPITKEVLGCPYVSTWSRKVTDNLFSNESEKWHKTVTEVTELFKDTNTSITFVGDRENDILSFFEAVIAESNYFIVRARHDRNLENENKVSETIVCNSNNHLTTITIPRNRVNEKERIAECEVKYGPITFPNNNGEDVKINYVSITELNDADTNNSINWVIYTNHEISNFNNALQIIAWYRDRWVIEEVHRTMKNKGLKIEDSQIRTPKKLQIISILCFNVSVKVMMLVRARDGSEQPAKHLFTVKEIKLLAHLNDEFVNMQKKSKRPNPHVEFTMGWASWIIARIGDWQGYDSEHKPGPITMHRGLQRFYNIFYGWNLAQRALDVCIG